jgi:hypothetical protein
MTTTTQATVQCASPARYVVTVPLDDVQSRVCASHLHDAVSAAREDLHTDPDISTDPDGSVCQWIADAQCRCIECDVHNPDHVVLASADDYIVMGPCECAQCAVHRAMDDQVTEARDMQRKRHEW